MLCQQQRPEEGHCRSLEKAASLEGGMQALLSDGGAGDRGRQSLSLGSFSRGGGEGDRS